MTATHVGFTVCDVDDGTPAFSVRFGQQRAACADERGHERLEQLLERDCGVGLRGYERAVDRGEGDSREPDGHGALGVVAERERDLLPEAVQPELAYARHDSLDFTAGARGRLYGEDDEQAKEVGMALERSAAVERTVAKCSAGRPSRRFGIGRSSKKRSAPRSITASRIPSLEP